MRTPYIFLLMLLSSVSIVSCDTAKSYQPKQKVSDTLYRELQNTDASSIAQISWKEFFLDSELQVLIQEGLDNNLDLKMGLERISMAYSMLNQSKASLLPNVAVGAELKQSKLSSSKDFNAINSTGEYGIFTNVSWEADIWGKLAAHKRVSFYKWMQIKETQQAVKTQLIAQIADYYYQLLTLDEQYSILEKTIKNRELDVKTMYTLKESNIVTGAAVVQSEANYYDALANLPSIRRQIRELENALSVLLGKAPEPSKRGNFINQVLYSNLSSGVPIELLSNRPDVKAAELALSGCFDEINVAKRSFYPTLTLTAATGFSSFDFKDWFSATGFFANIASGLVQPIFNRRMNKTRLEIAKATYQEKLYSFEKVLLTAGQEVSDALYQYESAKEQEEKRLVQVDKLALAVEYTKRLLVYHSSTNYTDVLTSEQSYLSAQIQVTNDRLLKWQATIKLYRSLGGGVR